MEDPLEAIGIVILGAGKPVVLCTVDWTGILNEAHLKWREALAEGARTTDRNRNVFRVTWLKRCEKGIPLTLGALHLNKDTALLHLPAEVFIEYQLAAQQATPEKFVTTVAYGDDGPWYIPTAEAYPQGGYEVSVAFCKPGIARKGVTDHWTRLAVLSAALPRDASMLKDLLEDKTLTSSAGPSKLLSPLALKPASSFSQAGMHTVENCVMKSSNCYWHVKNDSVPCSMLWSREKLPPTNSTRYGGTCLLPTKHTDITTRAKKLFSGADSRAGVLTRYKEVPSLKGDSAKENSFTNPSASLATSSAKKASSIWLPISPSSPDGMPNAS